MRGYMINILISLIEYVLRKGAKPNVCVRHLPLNIVIYNLLKKGRLIKAVKTDISQILGLLKAYFANPKHLSTV